MRQYELTKHVSLRHLDPTEFLRLKSTGKCMISLSESLFNQDNPSHYLRRIKSVSLPTPCVVGPYTSVNCKLTLLSSKTRIKSNLLCKKTNCFGTDSKGYLETKSDTRFVNRYGAKDAIATSSGQNESDMFELNFNDNRYLHFEYEGVISNWCLELPIKQNYFDMQSLSDVIMHINYMAKEGGILLGSAAKETSSSYLPGNGMKLLDIRSEFPDAWYEMTQSIKNIEADNLLSLSIGRKHFPFIPGRHSLNINHLEVFFEVCDSNDCNNFELGVLLPEKDCADKNSKCDIDYFTCVKQSDFGCLYRGFVDLDHFKIDKMSGTKIQLILPENLSCVENLYLVANYGIERVENTCIKTDTLVL